MTNQLEVKTIRYLALAKLADEAKAELEKEQKKVSEPFEYASYGIRHKDKKERD